MEARAIPKCTQSNALSELLTALECLIHEVQSESISRPRIPPNIISQFPEYTIDPNNYTSLMDATRVIFR